MKPLNLNTRVLKIALCICSATILIALVSYKYGDKLFQQEVFLPENYNGVRFPYFIVPNIVHFVHFGKPQLSFVEVIAIKSAFINQKPDRIIIHCDCYNMTGEYWDLVKDIGVLELKYRKKPETALNGKKFSYVQHASDVARIEVLMEYGGIYLDSDVYVVKSLDKYRKFEFAIGWDPYQYIGNQVMIGYKNASFLKLYYETYHDYRPDEWYYNGGQLPTKSILYKRPYLVHRVVHDFGVYDLTNMLYLQRSNEWRQFVTIHLLFHHTYLFRETAIDFNMKNIRTYKQTFGDMARLVLFGSTDILPDK